MRRRNLSLVLVLLSLAVAAGCDVFGPDDEIRSRIDHGLAFTAEHRVDQLEFGRRIATWLTVTNMGVPRIRGTSDGCYLLFAAYRTPERSGTPVWEENGEICTDIQVLLDLPPNASEEHGPFFLPDFRQMAGPGRYYLTVRLQLRDPAMISREFAIGDIEL